MAYLSGTKSTKAINSTRTRAVKVAWCATKEGESESRSIWAHWRKLGPKSVLSLDRFAQLFPSVHDEIPDPAIWRGSCFLVVDSNCAFHTFQKRSGQRASASLDGQSCLTALPKYGGGGGQLRKLEYHLPYIFPSSDKIILRRPQGG